MKIVERYWSTILKNTTLDKRCTIDNQHEFNQLFYKDGGYNFRLCLSAEEFSRIDYDIDNDYDEDLL